jgi:divalent metal cation (Fe/Co/Zn/Cd) transporter
LIRAILVVGWIGLLLLGAAAWLGYQVMDEPTAERHLVVALFPTGALLFANLCVLIYLRGTRRLVRRTTAELGLGGEWPAEQDALARTGMLWAMAAALALGSLFGSGFPVFTRMWPAWVHHGLFALVVAMQALFLLRGGHLLRHGERRLAAFASAVDAAGGR